ncbi:hypothetical protein NUU61_009470 [Penicillium alfredii]|uniref:Uncharacterized protein n=1 Tax=Penicillium alfredii TaxID=1506179 RepID=A0A9W9EN82_9EURO|nr:uncharacterized protein NUU61_009470 [Penicillium alfredii]KAJ5084891.1 hypothetical protein NUU61_009470 [Penicillium alfredii]
MRRKKGLVSKQQSPSQNKQKTVDPAPKGNPSYSLFLPTFYPMSTTTPPPEENTKCPTSSSSSTASTVVEEPQDDVIKPILTRVSVPTPSRVSMGTQTIETGEETMPMGSLPLHFVCTHCQVPRSVRLHGLCICIYCLQHEQKYCVRGQHEMDRPDFVDLDGMEYEVCNQCRSRDS